jgi:uncharacterized lipoprotein YmbA
MKTRQLLFLIAALIMVACRQTQVPASYKQLQKEPLVYPDYIGVTVPVNIAPLNF